MQLSLRSGFHVTSSATCTGSWRTCSSGSARRSTLTSRSSPRRPSAVAAAYWRMFHARCMIAPITKTTSFWTSRPKSGPCSSCPTTPTCSQCLLGAALRPGTWCVRVGGGRHVTARPARAPLSSGVGRPGRSALGARDRPGRQGNGLLLREAGIFPSGRPVVPGPAEGSPGQPRPEGARLSGGCAGLPAGAMALASGPASYCGGAV